MGSFGGVFVGQDTIVGVDMFGSGWVWNGKTLSWVGWVKLGFLIHDL